MDYKKKGNIIVFVLGTAILGSILFISLLTGNRNNQKLNQEYKKTKAKIVEFEKSIHTTLRPTKFTFLVNNNRVTGQLESGVFCKVLDEKDKKELKKIEFDIVYYPQNPIISQLLYSKELYDLYNIEYPKSSSELDIIFEKYFNCKWSFWRYLN